MKTTNDQYAAFAAKVTAAKANPALGVWLDAVTASDLLDDLAMLQRREAAGAVPYKAPVVLAYVKQATEQASELLALLQRAAGDEFVDPLEEKPTP